MFWNDLGSFITKTQEVGINSRVDIPLHSPKYKKLYSASIIQLKRELAYLEGFPLDYKDAYLKEFYETLLTRIDDSKQNTL